MQFNQKLAEQRKKHGLSQEQLAEQLNVTRQAVSKWESGTALPDVQNIIALSALFDVPTDYLLKEEVELPDMQRVRTWNLAGTALLVLGLVCAAAIRYEYQNGWAYLAGFALHAGGLVCIGAHPWSAKPLWWRMADAALLLVLPLCLLTGAIFRFVVMAYPLYMEWILFAALYAVALGFLLVRMKKKR